MVGRVRRQEKPPAPLGGQHAGGEGQRPSREQVAVKRVHSGEHGADGSPAKPIAAHGVVGQEVAGVVGVVVEGGREVSGGE